MKELLTKNNLVTDTTKMAECMNEYVIDITKRLGCSNEQECSSFIFVYLYKLYNHSALFLLESFRGYLKVVKYF